MRDEIKIDIPVGKALLPFWRVGVVGFCLVIFVVGVFWLGGYYSCSSGGGEVLGFPFPKCVDVESVGSCEIDGEEYVLPDFDYGIEYFPEGGVS